MDISAELSKLETLIASGDFTGARRLHSAVIGLLNQSVKREQRLYLRFLEAKLVGCEGHYASAIDMATTLFRECRESGEKEWLARSHLLLSGLLLRAGEYSGAQVHSEAAIYLCTWEVEDKVLEGDACNNLGLAHKNIGRWDEAERCLRRALKAFGGSRDPVPILRTTLNLAILLRKMGRLDEAADMCEEGLELAREEHLPLLRCSYALELANIDVIRRDLAGARGHLQIARSLAEENAYLREGILVLEIEGDLRCVMGDSRAAHGLFVEGLDLAKKSGIGGDVECELLRRAAQAASRVGMISEARGYLERAMSLAEKIKDEYEVGVCLRVLGEISVCEGVEGSGIDYLRQSVEKLSRMSPWSHEVAVSEFMLGRVLLGRKDRADVSGSLEHLLVARRIYSSLGVSPGILETDGVVASLISVRSPEATGIDCNYGLRTGLQPTLDLLLYGIVTCDNRIVGDIARWGDTDIRVLIEGETGVGKELVARAMHGMSKRREEKFIAVDCGALSESLAESELFGHAKGSFTGADRDRTGLIEAANGGTLFLDEVGELSEALQSKLLRVLEDGAVRRVGENKCRPVDMRVLSATTKDLWAEVQAGSFRRDLYYRLKGVVVRVPSLRERRDDIELLLDHFTDIYCEQCGKVIRLDDRARKALSDYDWPGNVRELKHVVEALVVSARDGEIISEARATEFLEVSNSGRRFNGPLSDFERREIERALEAGGGNRAEAARRLGISRKTLYQRLKNLRID